MLLKKIDLIEGNIGTSLIRLALPIMGTSFIQMAYNMTDMIWIGRVGSKSVAAVGTAGFFTWLSMAFVLISKIGAEVLVSQFTGKKDEKSVRKYIVTSLQINIILAIIYTFVLVIFKSSLISFFNLGDIEVISMAETYLSVVGIGIIFSFLNPVFTAIFNGTGNSKIPFLINTLGLIFNIIFDPVLIFGVGPFPKMGVKGAAVATVLAQAVVTGCFLFAMYKSEERAFKVNIFSKIDFKYVRDIVKIGIPVAFQNGLFTLFSMLIARIIAVWGPTPIAVQKVGSQIEAISWMTAGGLSTALSAFVGQNYGAKKYDRIRRGYFYTLAMASLVGILATMLLVFGGKYIFGFFIPEKEAIEYGVVYLRILGYSQLFMCIEITTSGAFNGLGKTLFPSIISILFTGLRVPAAKILSSKDILGLNGIWWSISISSVMKGIVLTLVFLILLKANKLYKIEDYNYENAI